MANESLGLVLRRLCQMADSRRTHELADGELLDHFLGGDETAFAALVQRHGGFVLSVCRRVLHDLHDAEDAFQATFLVLAQKAGSIRRRQLVVSWLHQVAYHIAVKARADATRV